MPKHKKQKSSPKELIASFEAENWDSDIPTKLLMDDSDRLYLQCDREQPRQVSIREGLEWWAKSSSYGGLGEIRDLDRIFAAVLKSLPTGNAKN